LEAIVEDITGEGEGELATGPVGEPVGEAVREAVGPAGEAAGEAAGPAIAGGSESHDGSGSEPLYISCAFFVFGGRLGFPA
jgi:hypothetical protein